MIIADTLSHAYLPQTDDHLEQDIEVEVHHLKQDLPVSQEYYEKLQQAVKQDLDMQQLIKSIIGGWPQ